MGRSGSGPRRPMRTLRAHAQTRSRRQARPSESTAAHRPAAHHGSKPRRDGWLLHRPFRHRRPSQAPGRSLRAPTRAPVAHTAPRKEEAETCTLQMLTSPREATGGEGE